MLWCHCALSECLTICILHTTYDDGPSVDFNSVADASAGGQRCIDKVIKFVKDFSIKSSLIPDHNGGGDRV